MALATVTAEGRGATDRLLAGVVARLEAQGVRLAGALRAREAGQDPGLCNADLRLLPGQAAIRITQELGPGSSACRLDAGALEEAVGLATARLVQEGADLVVLNKFGLSEAEGRGFRGLIGAALERGIPVLLGLPDVHRAAFERFAEDMAVALEPKEAAVLEWCGRAIRSSVQERA